MDPFIEKPSRLSGDQIAERLASLVAASRTGKLTEVESSELNQLLEESAVARRIYLQMSHDSQTLRMWAAAKLEESPTVSSPILLGDSEKSAMPFNDTASGLEDGLGAGNTAMSAFPSGQRAGVFEKLLNSQFTRGLGLKFGAAAACIAFLLTAGIALHQSSELNELKAQLNAERMRLATSEPIAAALPAPPSSPYSATLVSVTNCRWDTFRSTADVESGILQPGQLLNLLEGVAEVRTSFPQGGIGRFQLEGPLGMMLTSQGMPSVQFGKLAAQVACDLDRFTLDTPMGRATMSQEASLGIIVSVNEVELHMFAGDAVFELLGSTGMPITAANLRVAAGGSLKISAADDGDPQIRRATADESRFVTQVSMAASRLQISDKYVEAIRSAKPIGYWRFEHDSDGVVRNEIGDHLHCRARGEGVRWRSYGENRAAEFGGGKHFGYLVTEDTIDGMVSGDYSLECWIKPSHLHHGSVLGFTDGPATATEPGRSGFVLELGGPSELWFSRRPPGLLRFLHRNPPAHAGGTSCYSTVPYSLRAWQHIGCVKEGAEMRLYIDGALAGQQMDPTPLADGLRVTMGQLYPHDHSREIVVRPFVGELDEVALYGRALTQRELSTHHQLGRTTSESNAKSESPDS